jgi:two-component system cell cycle sensor histidine kinase/response regulator CckA
VRPDEALVGQLGWGVRGARYALLTVSDTGSGIEPAIVDQVFEPFFTTKEPGQGTGLGLSSVYGTVRQSGGHIAVDTTVGEGTTFRIYLPQVDDQPEGAGPDGDEGPSGSGVILLAEDEPAVRALARRVLERAGYTVLEAVDGEQARQICARHDGPIDLVLTDVVMPRLSGAELAVHVARLRPGTRMLLMSGYTQDALGRRGVIESAGFLGKPFSPELLRRAVGEALRAPPPAAG